jgi:hypothetical protein
MKTRVTGQQSMHDYAILHANEDLSVRRDWTAKWAIRGKASAPIRSLVAGVQRLERYRIHGDQFAPTIQILLKIAHGQPRVTGESLSP